MTAAPESVVVGEYCLWPRPPLGKSRPARGEDSRAALQAIRDAGAEGLSQRSLSLVMGWPPGCASRANAAIYSLLKRGAIEVAGVEPAAVHRTKLARRYRVVEETRR